MSVERNCVISLVLTSDPLSESSLLRLLTLFRLARSSSSELEYSTYADDSKTEKILRVNKCIRKSRIFLVFLESFNHMIHYGLPDVELPLPRPAVALRGRPPFETFSSRALRPPRPLPPFFFGFSSSSDSSSSSSEPFSSSSSSSSSSSPSGDDKNSQIRWLRFSFEPKTDMFY